jgi:PAS domain S-box-containing protein
VQTGVLIIDSDTHTIVDANPAAAALIGTPREQLLGRTCHQHICSAEVGHCPITDLEQAIDNSERVILRSDGARRSILKTVVPILLNGRPHLLESFVDITARKQAEQAHATRTRQLEALRATTADLTRELELAPLLRLLIARAAELVGASSATVYLWEPDQGVVVPAAWHGLGDWQATLRHRLGHGIAGTVAATRRSVLANDYRASRYANPVTLQHTAVTASLGEPLLYREELIGAITLNHEGGRTFTEEDQGLLRLFANQAAVAIANARLFREEHHGRAQLEAVRAVSAEITQELNLGKTLRLVVQRACTLTHAAAADIDLWDPERQILVPEASYGHTAPRPMTMRRLGEGAMGTVAETRRGMIINDYRSNPVAHPATLAHTAITASLVEPLLYGDTLLGVIGVDHETPGRTFTPQDQEILRLFAVQAAIAIENARLFRDQQRAYLALQHAQDKLVRTEKLRGLGQMAAGIAHDLNNILATILGQAELLRLRARHPEMTEGLQTLQTAANDGAQVVRRLQDFARQRSGGPLDACDLGQLVPEALDITRPRWREESRRRGIVIQTSVDLAGLPAIQGNPAEIREILTNLIFNAVDAMPSGGSLRFTGHVVNSSSRQLTLDDTGTSESTPRHLDASTGWVELAVSDTGLGMTTEVQRRIFDPFFTTKGLHGTGLGLSVVYSIMERHGGQIDVTSAPGQGATFRLRFRPANPEAEVFSGCATPAVVPSRRILLVDDDPAVRQTLAALLRASGQDVLEADGGAAALRRLEATSVDLVITDLGMPDVTGWDVARAVKARHPDLPIVLLTGWGDQVGAEAPADVLVDRVLTKPVPRHTVLAVIAELTGPR